MHESTAGDHQLLLVDADTVGEMRERVAHLIDVVRAPTFGGLRGLAATLQGELADRPVRGGVVAEAEEQAAERLIELDAALYCPVPGLTTTVDVANGVFAGQPEGTPAIGFLFPGQGADVATDESALTRLFAPARDLYKSATPTGYQQRIVTSCVAGLRVLSLLGIEASAAAGHSLGELTALHWAGALTETELFALVDEHSQIMADECDGSGTMARIGAGEAEIEPLLRGEPVVVAGYNTASQTVVAGPTEAVARVRQAALAAGLKADGFPVADAFHTPAMAPAANALRTQLAGTTFRPLERAVVSTVTGDVLALETDVRELLVEQVCEPVRFWQALQRMAERVDLIVEVGPDRLLSFLALGVCPTIPYVPLTTESASAAGVLSVAAAAYVLGAPVRHGRLVAGY